MTIFEPSLTFPHSFVSFSVFLQIEGLDIVADKALIGFLKVLVGVNRDLQVIAYRDDKRLMGENGPFNLRMGFGLHAGWAIEGAVGSLQKVDATYLSPHVNMTARIETAAKKFGVGILMSERFHEVRLHFLPSDRTNRDVSFFVTTYQTSAFLANVT